MALYKKGKKGGPSKQGTIPKGAKGKKGKGADRQGVYDNLMTPRNQSEGKLEPMERVEEAEEDHPGEETKVEDK